MFQDYSKRALQIVFEARFKAGQRGSDAVDVGDLLFALLREDQDRFRELILQKRPEASGLTFPLPLARCGVAPAGES